MEELTIYHNPTCSKSLCALDYLDHENLKYRIVEYLNFTPDINELKVILTKLNMKAFDLIRKNEELFIKEFEGQDLSEEQWIEVLVNNPKLIERPIVMMGDKAVVARPVEKISELLNKV